MTEVTIGTRVLHPKLGLGTVQMCQGPLVIVEFDVADPQLQRVESDQLEPVLAATDVESRDKWDSPLETLCRSLGEAIVSVNDAWGVFSPSNIDLLPHQLWVCKKVNETWPTRWLIADDVGLGKTVEAGLVLWPLISRGLAKRVLIMTPASLVEQWSERLYDMFDIRVRVYKSDEDTPTSRYWEREDQVVASFHTLRADREGRHERLLEADPWDLVIVDEAHHIHYDKTLGPTQAYKLLQGLEEAGKIHSMVFFTGTPHRGKDWGFLSLLQLLRKDLFSPRAAMGSQIQHLPKVLIRNNKYSVTDLQGNRLFRSPNVRQIDYEYSPAEQRFYDLVSTFIEKGYAYSSKVAKSEGQTMGNAVALVLIAIQKLAASSVAAVLRALEKRLGQQTERRGEKTKLEATIKALEESQEAGDNDRLSELEEQLFELSASLRLMEDEEPHLMALIEAARAVHQETKIEFILELLQGDFAGRQVLFFTEYKATQSLLLSRLCQTFGRDSAVFINGDGRATEVHTTPGRSETLTLTRQQAAQAFNEGRSRFLVATEAGGEGIDLQERCHTLIHVDVPWNPMRLHQRVGRVNRYGQTETVDVAILANKATVEARIFDKLQEKLASINRAFDEVMEEPEDLFSLVLGMAPGQLFNELYSEGRRQFARGGEAFANWFDAATATIGGKDIVDTVKSLIGNCAKFNFQEVSSKIPKVDIEDLKPFFQGVLHLNHRRLQEETMGYSFITPDAWKARPLIRPRYKGLHFERRVKDKRERKNILGVGNVLVTMALEAARTSKATLTMLPKGTLEGSIHVFRVTDQLVGSESSSRFEAVGVQMKEGEPILLLDWELIHHLNRSVERSLTRMDEVDPGEARQTLDQQQQAEEFLAQRIDSLEVPFKFPILTLVASLCC